MADGSAMTNANGQTATADMPAHASRRQPLGQVSPNVERKLFKSEKTSSIGSPLKRSFTAAIDSEQGFTYIKKRRPSRSPMLRSTIEISHGDPSRNADAEVASFRLATHETSEELPPLVSSQARGEAESDHDGPRDRDSSSERQSFSSLINYDPSSQALQPSSQQHLHQSSDGLANQAPSLHAVIRDTSRAEVLRLKLRVAMYKVQTNQIHTPFDYLRERTEHGLRESSRAVEEAVEQLRQEAQEVLIAQQQASSLRSNDPAHASTHSSSPEPDCAADTVDVATLGQHMLTPKPRFSNMLAPDLTSSAVKSNVAEGLLGLRNGL